MNFVVPIFSVFFFTATGLFRAGAAEIPLADGRQDSTTGDISAVASVPKALAPTVEVDVREPAVTGTFQATSDATGKLAFPNLVPGTASDADGPDLDLGYTSYVDVRITLPASYHGDVLLNYRCTGPGPDGTSETKGNVTIPGPVLLRDGLEHGYRLDLGLQPYWRGRLLSLELEATGGKVDFTHASVAVGDIPGDSYEANLETPGTVDKDPLVLSSYEAESKHFRIVWSGERNQAGFTRKNALGTLRNAEQIWQFYVKVMHLREPCYSMDSDVQSGTKFKINILNLYMGYYMSGSDRGFGYTNIEGSGLRVDPPGWVLPHELMHVFEMHQGGQMPDNWWEAYANYGTERWIAYYAPFLFPDRSLPGGQVSSLETGYAMMSNWILPHGRDYYLCWPIFCYLDENPDHLPGLGGGDFTPKLWQQAKSGETIFDTVQRLTKGATSTKSILGLFTRRNVTWDYANQPAMRKNVDLDLPDLRRFALTDLEQRGDDPTWWRVPLDRAPQQGGYTVHELKLAPGNKDRTVSLTFRGLHDTVRGADWRPSLVVVDDHGGQRYGSMWNEHANSFNLAPDENRLYLVVPATPDLYLPGEFDDEEFPFQSSPQRQRFPYEVQLKGALPVEFDNGDHAGLIKHPNGGGWISPSATAADTAYIGPNARVLDSAKVLGEARVEDYAVVQGTASVLDHAIISGHGLVSNEAIVKDFAKVRDWGGISGSAVASFQARIIEHGQVGGSAVVSDYATVEGYATVWKDTPSDRVGGDAVISGDYGGGCSVVNGFQFGFMPYRGTLQQWIDDRTAPAHLYVDYEFDKANQSLAKDFYGISDGVLEGAPEWSGGDFERSGVLLFNGQDQYVSLPRQTVDFHEGTFMCWVRPGLESAHQPVFSFGDATHYFYAMLDNGKGFAELVIHTGDEDTRIVSESPMPLTKWVHLAVALDGTTAALFVNGRMVISKPCPLRPDQFLAPNVTTGQQQNYLGRGIGHLPFFKGAIDSFRVYSKALLNDGEVAREMEREPER